MGSRIARRYAKALLSLGQEDGNYPVYGEHLREFAEFCQAQPEFFQVVSNRIFSVEDRRSILDKILERTEFPDMVKNFLRLLVDKNRIGEIHHISEHYTALTDAISNVTRARIATAKTLKQKALDDLIKALEGFTAKTIKAEVVVDPSLIGGVVVQIGDTILDGSVKAQLEGLKESLKRGEYI